METGAEFGCTLLTCSPQNRRGRAPYFKAVDWLGLFLTELKIQSICK